MTSVYDLSASGGLRTVVLGHFWYFYRRGWFK